jgi:3-deoxy-D-manno-octulosonate 8-phosphate phosphatase (KDO 8-P phosphatase)
MRSVGLCCCPQDSCRDILEMADYISPFKGGEGCVRDVLEKVMRLQGKWSEDISVAST